MAGAVPGAGQNTAPLGDQRRDAPQRCPPMLATRVTPCRAPGVYEMTWAPDGRATWEYGDERFPGIPHVIWRRVGTHSIFNPGPPCLTS